MADFTQTVQTQFVQDTADLLEVAYSRIVISSTRQGSVVVEFDVLNVLPTPVPPVTYIVPPSSDVTWVIETWVIIVIVIACVAVLASVIVIICCCCSCCCCFLCCNKNEEENAKQRQVEEAEAPKQAPY